MSRVLHLVPPDELGLLLFIYLSASVFYVIQQTLLRMWFPAPPNKLNKFFWIQFFSLTPSSFIPPPLFLTSVDLWFSFPEHRARHCGKKGKSGGGGESREGLDGRAEKKMGEAGALRKHLSSYFPSLLFSQEDEGVGLVRGRGSESTHVTPLILTLRWDEILHLLRFFTYHKSILFVWKEPQNKKKNHKHTDRINKESVIKKLNGC